VRALNAYGFRKSAAGQWRHENFRKDHPEELKLIVRKATAKAKPGPSNEIVPVSSARVPLKEILRREKLKVEELRGQISSLEAEAQHMHDVTFRQKYRVVGIFYQVCKSLRIEQTPWKLPNFIGDGVLGPSSASSTKLLTHKQQLGDAQSRDRDEDEQTAGVAAGVSRAELVETVMKMDAEGDAEPGAFRSLAGGDDFSLMDDGAPNDSAPIKLSLNQSFDIGAAREPGKSDAQIIMLSEHAVAAPPQVPMLTESELPREGTAERENLEKVVEHWFSMLNIHVDTVVR